MSVCCRHILKHLVCVPDSPTYTGPRPSTMRLVGPVLLSSLLALTACDTASPGAGEVRLTLPMPDLEVDAAGSLVTVNLAVRFAGNDETGALRFTAETISGGGIDAEVEGATLSIRPVSEGEAMVRVEARGEHGGTAVDTFGVRVVGPCPAAGEAVAFPVAVGQRWVYDRSAYSKMTSQLGSRSSGRVEVEVVAARACRGDAQPFEIRERRTELIEREVYREEGVVWEADEDSTTSERMYLWTVTDTSVVTDAPDLQGRPGAGLQPPPFGREAPRFWDSETYRLGDHTAFGPYVTLTQGVGPTRYSTQTLFGTVGQGDESWEYVGE